MSDQTTVLVIPGALAAQLAVMAPIARPRALVRLAFAAAGVVHTLGARETAARWSAWAIRRRVAEINGALGKAGIVRRIEEPI